MRTRVLVLATQAQTRAAVARILMPRGYCVEAASNEKTARRLIGHERFAAAIVAASAAAGELALLQELRNAVGRLVILADDARMGERLAKSFPEALVAASQRLEHEKLVAFLDKQPPQRVSTNGITSEPEFLHFAGLKLDVAGRILQDANRQEVALTRGEFALLVTLVRNPGRALARAQLRNAMDGGSAEAYDRSIDMLVARLRRKIEPDPAKPQFIVTVPGAGYKFVPGVHRGDPPTGAPPASPHQLSSVREAPRAERRQVTILSCQILGFAALAAKVDPEDLEHSISPVYAACAEVIARFGGTTMRTFGDSVLAYFGYPKAQENDAESAVRAALELLRVIRVIEAAPIGHFRARIGIATGLVVIGELAAGETRQPTAIGEPLNLALHMQQSAPPDGVVIAASSRDLIGSFFQCRQIEPVEMEEGHEPAPAWRVLEEIAEMPRFDALRRDGMLDLVGREAEIERLQQCWTKALRGSGQIALLTGEAGIGKSRLVIELQKRLCGEPHAMIRWFGLPHRSNAPMSAIIEELQRSAGFTGEEAVSQKAEKLQREFAALGAGASEATALGCSLMGLPYEAAANIGQLSPQKRKERTFAALLGRFDAIASRQPVLAVVEDIHWLDPTSLEFVTALVERAGAMRLLLIVVARPEFAPSWPDHSYVTTLAPSRLSRSDSAVLIHQVAGERRIPESIEAAIIARADGVPLFVEELTKSILETSANGGHGGALCAPAKDVASIPTTLQGLLLARFDRLDRGKEVAQAGAVIGREFSFELLRMVTNLDESTLRGALDQLVASGLVFRRGTPPQATFVFKHALVRDAAYNMLVRERRRKLHAAVAQAYEAHFAETVAEQPELLAYHFREARDPIKSIGYLLAAAERALLRSASTEALLHLAQARELTAELPVGSERLQLELKLEITLARTLLARSGYTAPETRAAYRRARQHCEALGDQAFLPLTMHGQWVCAWVAADYRSALDEARQLYLWGERNNEPVGLAVAHSDLGLTLTTLGQLANARHHLDQALRINKFILPGREPFVASDADGRISTLSFAHHCLLLLGFPEQAEAAANEAAALRPDNMYSRALAQARMLRTRVFERDVHGTAAGGLELLHLAQQQGYPFFIGTANIYLGWALAQRGEIADGTEMCQKGLAELRAIGANCWLPFYLALLAECHKQAGDRDRAAEAVAQALSGVEATDERVWEAEIYRLRGKLLDLGGDADAAAACFTTALQKAQAQQAKLLELRAALSLAKLLKRKREAKQAREVLAPVYGSFTEGFNFIDVREAKLLLDTLLD